MRRVRSLLFTPGGTPKFLEKGLRSGSDAQILDLEDSVAAPAKDAARATVRNFLLATPNTSNRETPMLIARVNNTEQLLRLDLRAVCAGRAVAVTVPKVESAEEVHKIDLLMSEAEIENEVRLGSLRLIPWIETARGVTNAVQIAMASPRISALAFGADDFCADMRVEKNASREGPESPLLMHARLATSVAARAAGIECYDTPWTDLATTDENARALAGFAARSRQAGFSGMFAIHPSHVAAINQAFSPSKASVEKARALISQFVETARNEGKASISHGGEMVDVPVLKQHLLVLEEAHVDAELCKRARELIH